MDTRFYLIHTSARKHGPFKIGKEFRQINNDHNLFGIYFYYVIDKRAFKMFANSARSYGLRHSKNGMAYLYACIMEVPEKWLLNVAIDKNQQYIGKKVQKLRDLYYENYEIANYLTTKTPWIGTINKHHPLFGTLCLWNFEYVNILNCIPYTADTVFE